MKNIKIFPKEWLKLHPYNQSDPTDLYYTNIANKILDIMDKTELSTAFSNEENIKVALALSAYFEDVISQLNIWHSFITEHKRLYGKYIPFYTVDDHYYDDEVNQEDITFLVWHYVQQYRGYKMSTFISPDNEAIRNTGKAIYDLFCDEWTTAPENERMQQMFSHDTRYDEESIYPVVTWFYYQNYLFPKSQEELSEAAKEYMKTNNGNVKDQDLMNMYTFRAFTETTPLLSYTAPQWLTLIFDPSHPDYAVFKDKYDSIEKEIKNDANKEIIEKDYNKFREIAGDKVLLYFDSAKKLRDFLYDNFTVDKEHITEKNLPNISAVGGSSTHGIEIISSEVDCIKDSDNPFYRKEIASKNAISFFMVDHCSSSLLRQLEEKGMLEDATAKSLISEERSKAIIHENWDFIERYFIGKSE